MNDLTEPIAEFTPYSAPDLTGLRAGKLVNFHGVLYDVERVEVRESLGGRDRSNGSPLAIETKVDIHRVYFDRGPRSADQDIPESIELQLVRNPFEDSEADRG
ncbi:hypothetical protein ACWEF6_02705 [Amycolatopsis sp. NPDC004772]